MLKNLKIGQTITANRKVKNTIHKDGIVGNFEAENYGDGLLDTNVHVVIEDVAITWKDKEKFMNDLENVLSKYRI